MKKAILILALSTQMAFAGGEATQNGTVVKNGKMAYIQAPAAVVSKDKKPGFLNFAKRKTVKKNYEAGLRRSLLRSNFR